MIILNFLSYSSLFIAFCALVLSLFYMLVANVPINPYQLSTVFLGTFLSYTGVQLVPIFKRELQGTKSLWIKKNRYLLLALMMAAALGISFNLKGITIIDLFNYGHLFIIILFYEGLFKDEIHLRKVPYLKSFLIAYIWACVCTVPVIAAKPGLETYWMWPECFCFIFALCLIFDIRDIEVDHLTNIKTLATRYSLTRVKLIAWLFFFASAVMSFIYLPFEMPVIIKMLLILVSFTMTLQRSYPKRHDYFFLYMVDGIILLKILLVEVPS